MLANWGLVQGPSIVVTQQTYKFLSVFLPLIATAITAYIVQKILKTYRTRQLKRDELRISQMDASVQLAVAKRMAALEQAQELGLITANEHYTKKALVYQSYARSGIYKILEILIKKFSA
jgi:hypothetical protein